MLLASWHIVILLLVVTALLYIKWEVSSLVMAKSIIPILSLSQNREAARGIAKAMTPYNFSINGIFEMDPYSSQDFALVLRVLEPRPQAVIMGRGYSEEDANQARAVFENYMDETGVSDGTLVKISDKVFDEVGKDGIAEWVHKQLEVHFRK